ncbi:hypothetical protein SASPL_147239 [Salvia splendens]|uniref:Uncharacterized protein n=1 Tax=Salvia splendens TaxID=180675 RepID=A0A8X8WF61_SALSN|nr:hypothetical protein SASPL_147239 [Salvia splendens]
MEQGPHLYLQGRVDERTKGDRGLTKIDIRTKSTTCIFCDEQQSDGNKVIQEIIFAPGEKTYRFVMVMLKFFGLSSFLLFSASARPNIGLNEERKALHTDQESPRRGELTLKLLKHPTTRFLPHHLVCWGIVTWYPFTMSSAIKVKPLLSLLREDPEGTLRGLCGDLGIPFQTAMLKFQYLTPLSKVEMEFGRVFEFITAKYSNWRSI